MQTEHKIRISNQKAIYQTFLLIPVRLAYHHVMRPEEYLIKPFAHIQISCTTGTKFKKAKMLI